MSESLVFEGVAEPDGLEDGGTAFILNVADEASDDGEWVRLYSSYEDLSHPRLPEVMGRRVRVTVEVLETGEEMRARETVSQRMLRESILTRLARYRERFAPRPGLSAEGRDVVVRATAATAPELVGEFVDEDTDHR